MATGFMMLIYYGNTRIRFREYYVGKRHADCAAADDQIISFKLDSHFQVLDWGQDIVLLTCNITALYIIITLLYLSITNGF